MKTHWLLAAFLFISVPLLSQSLTVDSVHVTPSICYNDGSVALAVSGGSDPYTFTITSGPSLPNVTYPIAADSASLFLSLHSGTYTVTVTDNAGHSIQYTVTIPGNYQFPITTVTVQGDSVIAHASSGRPPYRFCFSSTGPSGPFGPLQSDSVFSGLCTGTYYVRVVDSCGNFYTALPVQAHPASLSTYVTCHTATGGGDSITIHATGNPPYRYFFSIPGYIDSNTTGGFRVPHGYTCADTVYTIDRCGVISRRVVDCHAVQAQFCSNFSDSTAHLNVSGGSPPFNFKLYEFDSTTMTYVLKMQQDSGGFHHIPYSNINDQILIIATDSCGRRVQVSDTYLKFKLSNECPFNGKVYISITGYINSVTATCLNCVPQQTITDPATEYFTMDTGTYTIRVTDACGETRDSTFHIPDTAGIHVLVDFLSCNDVQASATSSDNLPLTSGVTYSIYGVSAAGDTISITDTIGYFPNLPTGLYTISAHYDGCYDDTTEIFIPHFSGFCLQPYFDTLCEMKLITTYSNPDLDEGYSLLSLADSTLYYEIPTGGGNGIEFNISPGNYVLSSDSGCAVNQNFLINHGLAESHYTNCLNQCTLILKESLSNSAICNPSRLFTYTLEDATGHFISQSPISPTDSARFFSLDTGVYIVRVYFTDSTVTFDSTDIPNGNKRCFIDSAIVRLEPHLVPQLNAVNVTVCGPSSTTDIPFSISNGFAPYYINTSGFPQVVTDSSTGVLPNVPIGSYTMIISDNCGISTSLTVQVIDSCILCDTLQIRFVVPDTIACTGDTVYLHANSTAGIHYNWSVNGNFISDMSQASFVADSGENFIQCIGRLFACYDTSTAVIRTPLNPFFELGPDTVFCEKQAYLLSAGDIAHWSTGHIGPRLIITEPGTYWAEVNGRCASYSDTVTMNWEHCPSNLHIPDAFTPNGDGTNDHFTVFGQSIIVYEIRIYNRWGELVYDSNDPSELNDLTRGWDGVYKGALQSTATFVYYVVAQGDDGTPYKEKGNLTLIR
jgi:gliding motility-associated-like protein